MEIKDILLKTIGFYSTLILISVLLSWFDQRGQMKVKKIIKKITDPYLNFFKIIIPLGGSYLDISPIIGILLLNLIARLVKIYL